jgi:hypothetical protein
LAKIRGWSLGGGGICARNVEGWAVGDSWPPRDERVGPWGEAEKMAEVLWDWLRSWFALCLLTQLGSLAQTGSPLSFAWTYSLLSCRDGVYG